MTIDILNPVGNWNPQLFRELKGRMTKRNAAIAAVISIAIQSLLLLGFLGKLPTVMPEKTPIWLGHDIGEVYKSVHPYCTEAIFKSYEYGYGDRYECVANTLGKVTINWPQWWLDIFVWMTFILTFGVLVLGTYSIIGDRATEERQGTFNFVRLSPQSATTISIGKLLGVPSLIYLAAFLAIPLHLVSAWGAGISAIFMLAFYAWFLAIAVTFFSAAMLFGSVGSWLGTMQPWIGSFGAFLILWIASIKTTVGAAVDAFNLFSPNLILHYAIASTELIDSLQIRYYEIPDLQFFYLPVGQSVLSSVALSFLVCGLATYWFFKGLHRCFFTPEIGAWSKKQSYFLIGGAEVLILGLSLQKQTSHYWPDRYASLFLLHLTVFLVAIAALTPHRQSLFDWARFRHLQRRDPNTKTRSLAKDLLWREKSPALLSIAANVAIATAILSPFAVATFDTNGWEVTVSFIFAANLLLIYAAIAQVLLMLKTRKRMMWALGVVGGIAIVPPIVFNIFIPNSEDGAAALWSLLVFPGFTSELPARYLSIPAGILAAIGQWLVLGLLVLQLTRQLHRAGASQTKTILENNEALARKKMTIDA